MTAPSGLFIIKQDDSLVGLSETKYDSEDFLQKLLARYPDLLAGDQIDPEAPRRWLLITRELGVPDDTEASDRWSLDHLFIDQDGIPTLVEVKRSTDTRIRREVVGQMLDYAANGVLHWPIETIRSAFEHRCQRDGKDAGKELQAFLGPESAADTFWMTVKTNLQAGRIRLLFVSDTVPAELKRVVEFLNRQMQAAEVLAVEVRQYTGQGLRTLLPRVFGQSAQAEQRRAGGTRRAEPWDERSFFAKLAEYKNEEATRVARTLFDWTTRRMRIEYGSGVKNASFIPVYGDGDLWFGPFRAYTGYKGGYVEIPLAGSGMQVPPFDNPERKLELVRRLNAIPGVHVAEDLARFPSIDFAVLATGNRFEKFIEVMDWALELVKEAGLQGGTG
jgi:hypothetical protein